MGFFRGNLTNLYKIFGFSLLNYNFLPLILYIDKQNKVSYYLKLTLSSIISSTLVYPLDLAATRLAADMGYYENKRIYSSALECLLKSFYSGNENKYKILQLYYGYFPYMIETSLINCSVFYCILNQYSYFHLLSFSLSLSLIIYPIETYKRNIQVKSLYSSYEKASIKEYISKGAKYWYRGLSFHLVKTLVYPFVLFFSSGYVNQYFKLMPLVNYNT